LFLFFNFGLCKTILKSNFQSKESPEVKSKSKAADYFLKIITNKKIMI
jgi:hypothetical protein